MRYLMVYAAVCVFALGAGAGEKGAPRGMRVGTFRCDITPPVREPMIWDVPLKTVMDPLWAKGVVLEQGRERYVLCTFDWCELCDDSELYFRRKIAEAAGTTVEHVGIATVHQHAAPYADAGAHKYLDEAKKPVLRLSDRFLADLGERLGAAVREATGRMEQCDTVGTGEGRVERVASARRLKGADGKIVVRYSGSGVNPAMAAAPEGDIDPWLKTVTLAKGKRPVVRMHFYATHPQTFACDGRASADFAGWAREEMERREGVFQVYFTGCAGNVTVGKYNDGTDGAREALGSRLLAGMERAAAETKWEAIGAMRWRSVELVLPRSQEKGFGREELLARIEDAKGLPVSRVYLGAMRLAYQDRLGRPLRVNAMEIGRATVLCLPGEPMVEFQRFAQGLRRDRFVAVGGYFDCGPGYICTDQAFGEGGYEPSATHAGIGSEAKLKQAIREALVAGTDTKLSSEGGTP